VAKPRTAPPSAPKTVQDDQSAADQDAGIEAGASSPDAASLDVVTAPATSTSSGDDTPSIWWFEVLSPFKHADVVVKPPAWIPMTWDEAEDYQDAGVLGDEPATPEELE